MQFPSGVLADRFGPVVVIAAGGLVTAGAAALLTVPAGFGALVAGMALVGLGTGAHKTVAIRLTGAVYPARTGRALGALDTLGALGGVAAPAAVVAAAETAGWRTAFAGAATVGTALVAAFLARVPARLRDGVSQPDATTAAGEGAGLRGYVGAFRDRRLLAFVVVTLCFSFAYNGVVAFLPLYLTDGGLVAAQANLLYSVLFGLALVQTVTGELSDRGGQLPVVTALLALAAAALAALVAFRTAGVVVLGAAVVAFGVGSHGFRPVRGAYLVAALPDDAAGGALGFVRTLLMAAGAVAPAVVGAVADLAGFGPAFGLLAAAMAAGAAVAAALVATG